MGLFSSKKKTSTYTSVDRMIEDVDLVSSQKSAVIEYILQDTLQTTTSINQMSIVDHINIAAANSAPMKWQQAYNFATGKTATGEDQYYFGVPTGTSVQLKPQDVRTVMQNYYQVNEEATHYCRLSDLNFAHYGLYVLQNTYQYSTTTGLISVEGVQGRVHGMQLHVDSTTFKNTEDTETFSMWENFGLTWGEPVIDDSIPSPLIEVSYGDGLILSIPVASTTLYDDFVMMAYDIEDTTRFVLHNLTQEDLPVIENAIISKPIGKFYPRMYARVNDKHLIEDFDEDAPERKTSVDLASTIGLDWENVVTELNDNIEGKNDIPQAFIHCAVPANTDDPIILEYLFKYFKDLHDGLDDEYLYTTEDEDNFRQEAIDAGIKVGCTFKLEDKAHTQLFSFLGIGFKQLEGTIGEVGDYATEFRTIKDHWTQGPALKSSSRSAHVYQYQVTENTYYEILVYGLTTTEDVKNAPNTVFSGEDEYLLIPLDMSFKSLISSSNYEQLIQKSMHITVNTTVVTETKWYQTGVFKAIMFIVAVVLSVWTSGQSLSIYAVVYAAAQALVISLVLNLAIKLLVKLGVTSDALMVIAIVAVIAGGVNALSNVGELASFTAQQFMAVQNIALQLYQQSVQLDIQELAVAMADMQEEYRDKNQILEELKMELDQTVDINEEIYLGHSRSSSFINLSETPDDFFMRTVHAGNIGTMAIQATLTKVEDSLALPKLTTKL